MGRQRHSKGRSTKGANRGGRSGSGQEVIYGRQPVRELLRAGRRRVDQVEVLNTVRESPELREILGLAEAKRLKIRTVDLERIDGLVQGGNHQGVAVICEPFRYVSYKKLLSDTDQMEAPLFLLLDHLEDPQNVGAILRTAETAGVTAVVIPEHRAAGITPAAVRASAGASEHIPVSQVGNLVRCMRMLKERGVWFAGLEGSDEAKLATETDLTGPLGLVVGSEGKGMRRLVRENCDYLIRLPMLGKIGSLNASVAGAIALYEVLRQRGVGQS